MVALPPCTDSLLESGGLLHHNMGCAKLAWLALSCMLLALICETIITLNPASALLLYSMPAYLRHASSKMV
jgi:hypothetical protein